MVSVKKALDFSPNMSSLISAKIVRLIFDWLGVVLVDYAQSSGKRDHR